MNRLNPTIIFALIGLPLLAAAFVAVFLTMGGQPKPIQYVAVLGISYLLGSVPWGYILLKMRMGVDIQQYGSGRTGMSNVLRTAGGKVAALVLLLDVSKGVLPVFLARTIIGTSEADVAAALLALIGHNWPVFLRFHGGRGIATGAGALTILAPISAAIGFLVFVSATFASRYVSLGSITGVVAASLAMLALDLLGYSPTPYTLYGFLGGGIIIWQHRDNIRRIREGNERRLGRPSTGPSYFPPLSHSPAVTALPAVHRRPETTLEGLAKLRAAFRKDGIVTAGNASGIVDGAAAVVVTTEKYAQEKKLRPLGRLVSWAVAGVEPTLMGIGPVPATRKALAKAGLELKDIDLIEVNEAFAPQYLAVEKELGLDRERTNVNGGAIALGHPLGATGTRLVLTLLYELRRRGARTGLATACIGGGQGIAVIVEAEG